MIEYAKKPWRLRRLVSEFGLKEGDVVLDVGTGTGLLLPFLVEVVGERRKIYALDFSEKMLQKAKEKNILGDIEYLYAIESSPSNPGAKRAIRIISTFWLFSIDLLY